MWTCILLSTGAWIRQMTQEGQILFSWARSPSFMPSEIRAPYSWAFGFGLGVTPLLPLVPRFQTQPALYDTSFPVSGLQTTDCGTSWLPQLHKPIPIINLFVSPLSVYMYIYSTDSISLENPKTQRFWCWMNIFSNWILSKTHFFSYFSPWAKASENHRMYLQEKVAAIQVTRCKVMCYGSRRLNRDEKNLRIILGIKIRCIKVGL